MAFFAQTSTGSQDRALSMMLRYAATDRRKWCNVHLRAYMACRSIEKRHDSRCTFRNGTETFAEFRSVGSSRTCQLNFLARPIQPGGARLNVRNPGKNAKAIEHPRARLRARQRLVFKRAILPRHCYRIPHLIYLPFQGKPASHYNRTISNAVKQHGQSQPGGESLNRLPPARRNILCHESRRPLRSIPL